MGRAHVLVLCWIALNAACFLWPNRARLAAMVPTPTPILTEVLLTGQGSEVTLTLRYRDQDPVVETLAFEEALDHLDWLPPEQRQADAPPVVKVTALSPAEEAAMRAWLQGEWGLPLSP